MPWTPPRPYLWRLTRLIGPIHERSGDGPSPESSDFVRAARGRAVTLLSFAVHELAPPRLSVGGRRGLAHPVLVGACPQFPVSVRGWNQGGPTLGCLFREIPFCKYANLARKPCSDGC